jgi:hypothetical protein
MGGVIETIPFDQYRSITSHVSISELNLFKIAPLLYKHRILDGHRDAATKAQVEGTAVHAAILEPEKFQQEYMRLPDVDLRTTAGKETKKRLASQHPEAILLSGDDYDRYAAARDVVRSHEAASKLLKGCEFEASMLWLDADTNVHCKGRVDGFNIHEDYVIDLKTTKDARHFTDSIVKYGYHRQAAYYLDGLSAATGRQWSKWYWIAVEIEPPFLCAVYEIAPLDLDIGRREYKELLKEYGECRKSGVYPGLPQTVQTIELPGWYRLKYQSVHTL